MKNKIIKALLLTFSILLIIGVILYLFPFIINLSTHEGQLAFKNEIDNLGVWGIIVLFMLQLLQIVLVVLPGEPLEILAGMCYGPIGGTIFIIVSVFITTTLIYLLVGKFGKKYLYNTFSKEKIQKIENSKLFKNPKKAFKTLKKEYSDGIKIIQKEFKLPPLNNFTYKSYKTYGWQVTTGTPSLKKEAKFVTLFLDIYENSFN